MTGVSRSRALAATVLGLAVATLVIWATISRHPASADPSIEFVPRTFADLSERAAPAVVHIRVTKAIQGLSGQLFGRLRREGSPFGEFFDRFFDKMPESELQQRGEGSGFLIDADGTIITNHHVVEDAREIEVKLSDDRVYRGEVIGHDPKTDLAVIKIEANGPLPVLPVGSSRDLRVGDWVIAIGNPFGLERTVTAGIVSAKGREIGTGLYDDFIQTDASINPGNSGGPLLNMSGEVVGINTAIVAQGRGIGFAIPIDLAMEIVPQLRKHGKVKRAWLGVSIQDLRPELAEAFGMREPKGALVADIIEDSPAAKAGFGSGDVIVEFDGEPVGSSRDLPRMVASTAVGKTVPVKVVRDKKRRTLRVKLGELEEEHVASAPAGHGAAGLGLRTRDVTPEELARGGARNLKGAVVAGVRPGSPAARAGLRQGDLIVEVNRQPVDNDASFRKRVASARAEADEGKPILMLVRRGEGSFYVALRQRAEVG